MARILLLEDDNILAQTVTSILQEENFNVDAVTTGQEALEHTFQTKYDLYLFDVNVPIISGFDVLKELRDAGDMTTTFFITALNDLKSLSHGFEIGGNDYIKKPFDLDEFIIRIRATLKKTRNIIRYKSFVFDPITDELFSDGEECTLSPIEKAILIVLLKNLDKVVEKPLFYEYMNLSSSSALRVHISHLKQKLSLNILNIRGVGYRLESL
jgi:DNA-binding response OmpR family regulator